MSGKREFALPDWVKPVVVVCFLLISAIPGYFIIKGYEAESVNLKEMTAESETVSDKTAPASDRDGNDNSLEFVDINSASAEEFMQLPGIGEALSERIIDTRERLGGFNTIDDIQNTQGISQKKFEEIKPYIYVGQSSE